MNAITRKTFQSALRMSLRSLAGCIAVTAALQAPAQAATTTETFRDIKVEVVGSGRPVLMIPGFNSAGDTWAYTCTALQADHVQCHIVTLPGFAGQPAATDASRAAWTSDISDRLLAYVKARKLERPVAMGHSLGGFLAMDMAIKQPDAFERVVIVDSLPFFSAAFNPAATAQTMQPIAEGMRSQMLAQDADAFRAALPLNLRGMTRDPARVEALVGWSLASDRGTSAQALYELMTRDLRADVERIKVPVLVLGAWAAYSSAGATKESTASVFAMGYQKLPGVRIEMSEGGYHFLMWDDPQWLQAQVRGFIAAPSVAPR